MSTNLVDAAGWRQSADNVVSSQAAVAATPDTDGPTPTVGAPPPGAEGTATAVAVVYVPYPGDCCPKTCRFKYWCWEAFLTTKLGDKWWTYRCYCKRLVDHRYFESFIIFMIMTSSISLVTTRLALPRRQTLAPPRDCQRSAVVHKLHV